MTDEPRVVQIVITPTTAQYQQIIEDLRVLRDAGGESNTGIILDAVHEHADRVRYPRPHLKAA